MQENWRRIAGSRSGYYVSDLGRVRGPRGMMSPCSDSDGYKQVRMGIGPTGKFFTKTVHALVCNAFIGPCPDGLEIDHVDGDKTNNRLANLERVTHSENLRRGRLLGLIDSRGTKQKNAKLTEANVHEIRKMVAEGVPRKDAAREFGVSESTISLVFNRLTWRHI